MIVIEDDVEVGRPDVWRSEIRVKEDKALSKILKHMKNPKVRSEKAEEVLKKMRRWKK